MQNTCNNLLEAKNNPIIIQTRIFQNSKMATGNEQRIVLNLETALQDYTKLIEEKVEMNEYVEDEIVHENYRKIAAAAREAIWKLLFEEELDQTHKAAELLRRHKRDACFHGPYDYNDWIVGVRDELLTRNNVAFWRDQIVAYELGPCWARDCDYFDDIDDPEPETFYRHAGCVAPFSKEILGFPGNYAQMPYEFATATVNNLPAASVPTHISLYTPKQDYTAMMEHQLNIDPDDEDKFSVIFTYARQVVWELLFNVGYLTKENYDKAAALLETYKLDACFYSPYDYNDWIVKLRDELFARKYYDFWQNVIVSKKCGLCWSKDSDYFDDDEDTRPMEFYKSGDHLMQGSC